MSYRSSSIAVAPLAPGDSFRAVNDETPAQRAHRPRPSPGIYRVRAVARAGLRGRALDLLQVRGLRPGRRPSSCRTTRGWPRGSTSRHCSSPIPFALVCCRCSTRARRARTSRRVTIASVRTPASSSAAICARSCFRSATAAGCWCSAANSPSRAWSKACEITLAEEPTPCVLEDGVLQVQNGPAIGQASDGALVVASDVARLRAALRGGGTYLKLGLPPEGAGGFALAGQRARPAGLCPIRERIGARPARNIRSRSTSRFGCARARAPTRPASLPRFATLGGGRPAGIRRPPSARKRSNSASS